MAKCLYCEKKGWFLKLTANGLCDRCDAMVAMDVTQRSRIIDDCIGLVNEGKTHKTRVSRCALLLEHTAALTNYERRGIATITPSPSALHAQYKRRSDELVIEEATAQVRNALAKADVAVTTRAKVNAASKAVLKLRELADDISDPEQLGEFERQLQGFIHKTQFHAYLDEARKAEFKNQRKRALDRYQEALYFLKTDDIPDELQGEDIDALETKIRELSGHGD